MSKVAEREMNNDVMQESPMKLVEFARGQGFGLSEVARNKGLKQPRTHSTFL